MQKNCPAHPCREREKIHATVAADEFSESEKALLDLIARIIVKTVLETKDKKS